MYSTFFGKNNGSSLTNYYYDCIQGCLVCKILTLLGRNYFLYKTDDFSKNVLFTCYK